MTLAKAASRVSVADSARAQSLVEPVVQRAEQVGDHRGDHDENEIRPQEVGAEQDRDDRRDRQRTLLGQREFGIHCGHWHTVARLRRRKPGLLSECLSAPRPGGLAGVAMKRIDMRCISPGASRANSHWACALRGLTSSALLRSMAFNVSRARRSASIGRLHALALQKVVAADEAADRTLVQNRGLDRRRADAQHADAVRGGLRAQRQRQPDDRVFGHHVAGDLSGRGQPGHRCGVDDVAVALPHHQRVGRGDTVHDTADVHVDDRVPLVEREQFGVAAPHDACVVEHQIQPAGAGDHVVDRRLHRGGVGDVEPGSASRERRAPTRCARRRRRRRRCRPRRRPRRRGPGTAPPRSRSRRR